MLGCSSFVYWAGWPKGRWLSVKMKEIPCPDVLLFFLFAAYVFVTPFYPVVRRDKQ